MNYTGLFYWLIVADNARIFFGWAVALFMLVILICIIAKVIISTSISYYGDSGVIERKDDHTVTNKYLFRSIPWAMLFWLLLIFTPTKRDALLIVAGGQTLNYLTTDSTAQKIPHEMTDFIVTELKSMAEEAKVEIMENKIEKDAISTKQRIINETKNLTADELLKKMKDDDIFKEIILEKLKE